MAQRTWWRPPHDDPALPPWRQPAAIWAFRQRCDTILRTLPIPVPFDERAFCTALGAQRGRRLILHPMGLRALTGDDVLYGVVLCARDRDVIYHERCTWRRHQHLIIAHECSHLILDHQGTTLVPGRLAALIPPGGQVRHVHRRDGTETREEFEAELLGRLILARADGALANTGGRDPRVTDFLDLVAALEGGVDG